MKNDDLHEILDILIEEASEVIQAASKVKRFGEHSDWTGTPNWKLLFQEIGDVKAMICLVELSMDGFDEHQMYKDSVKKLNKLKEFSEINKDFLDETIGLYDE